MQTTSTKDANASNDFRPALEDWRARFLPLQMPLLADLVLQEDVEIVPDRHGRPDFLRHPLLIHSAFGGDPAAVQEHRAHVDRKRQLILDAAGQRNWARLIAMVERPWRCRALNAIGAKMDDHAYWALVGLTWRDTEGAAEQIDDWLALLGSTRPHREAMMSQEDLRIYRQLPERITAYRGISGAEKLDRGVSWTLSRPKAKWFANRSARIFGGRSRVLSREIDHCNVIAYLDAEQEIIVLPPAR